MLAEISQHRKTHTTYSYLYVKSQTVKVLEVESEKQWLLENRDSKMR